MKNNIINKCGRHFCVFASLCLCILTSCMEWDYGLEESFNTSASGEGLFICNEGNFQYGNATLSYYDPKAKKVENEIFYRANAARNVKFNVSIKNSAATAASWLTTRT